MAKTIKTSTKDQAASDMLQALKIALDAMEDAVNGGEYWRDNFAQSDIPAVKLAIATAKAAGIR